MNTSKVNFNQKLGLFKEHWSPKIIAQMNNYHFKLAKLEGDFTWHDHKDTDEVFIVLEGSIRIDFRDQSVDLKEGEMLVVPKGVEHKPYAATEAKVLLIEPAGTVNTGDAGGAQTAPDDVWI
ncbi:cupin domain-containing protein [Spirochaeta cellobiosiphila]|uniref:cupin domain-containing protein n=1 Tax=Spirochaeta cellobiosiphila TaxID=504483 RepID=UPI0004146330|nr:cupin domain-containing protein [Spirochaeta cellobiosiphila]